jgi:hypothetical protein
LLAAEPIQQAHELTATELAAEILRIHSPKVGGCGPMGHFSSGVDQRRIESPSDFT